MNALFIQLNLAPFLSEKRAMRYPDKVDFSEVMFYRIMQSSFACLAWLYLAMDMHSVCCKFGGP
jgi:hypothetical protein